MNAKKVLITLITSFMIVGMFAGCSSDGTENVTTNEVDVTNSSEETTTSDVASEEVTEPVEFSIIMSDGLMEYVRQQPDINQEKWVLAFNEKFNANMEVILADHKTRGDVYQMMFASGDTPDVVMTIGSYLSPEMSGSVEAGIYMPLDDVLEKNRDRLSNLFDSIPEAAWDEVTYDGKIYGIPSVYLSKNATRATYVRKDLLESLDLEVPVTLDEYVDMLRAFKDEGLDYPYSGRQNFFFTDIFFGAFGVQIDAWNLNENGELVPDIIRPEMKEALEFLAMLNEEGLMDPETLTNTGSDWINKISTGEVGLFNHNASTLPVFQSKLDANIEGEFALIPSPVGPKGFKGMTKSSPVSSSIYINKKYDDIEGLLLLLNEIADPAHKAYFQLGIEGEDYTMDGDKYLFEYPTDPVEVSALRWRALTGLVRDNAYYDIQLPFTPGGDKILDWFENIAPEEGFITYDPGSLKIFDEKPELRPNDCALFQEYAAKIFFGEASVDTFDEFVAEYLKRGGDEVIKQATEKYNSGNVLVRK